MAPKLCRKTLISRSFDSFFSLSLDFGNMVRSSYKDRRAGTGGQTETDLNATLTVFRGQRKKQRYPANRQSFRKQTRRHKMRY